MGKVTQRGILAKDRINILIIDDEEYALLLLYELTQAGYAPLFERVDSADSMKAALSRGTWDLAIAGFSLPDFNAFDALWLVQEGQLNLPIIAVSRAPGEDVGGAVMMAGARDYIRKNDLRRLIPVIERERSQPNGRYGPPAASNGHGDLDRVESLELVASGVAHDFNNLLVAILGQCSIALDLLDPDSPARENLKICIEDAERATGLTRRMMSYAGLGPPALQTHDLNELIRENARLLETVTPPEIEFHIDLQGSLPPVNVNPAQMQKALMTLVNNASDAIGPQPGELVVSSRLAGPEIFTDGLWSHFPELKQCPNYVTLSVRDSGHPLTGEGLSEIFDPFFSSKESGRGIGLGALLDIMRAHQGGLQIQSDPASGTAFSLILPAVDETAEACLAEDPDSGNEKPRILVIDDEAAVREAISDILELSGVEVLTAANGQDGLKVFVQHQEEIGLVILDHCMPGLSGSATLEKLLEEKPGTRVLMTSGLSAEKQLPPLPHQCKVNYLSKPFNADQLLEAVAAAGAPAISPSGLDDALAEAPENCVPSPA